MEILVLLFILGAFLLGSYEDIKKKEIYNYLNYILAFFIFSVGIVHSLYIQSLDPFFYVGFGLLLGFALGTILYHLGVWGGGDAKFLIGFSGAAYYIIPFITQRFSGEMVNVFHTLINYFSELIVEFVYPFLLILSIILIIVLLISLFQNHSILTIKNIGILLGIFILFSLGFLLVSPLYLLIIGLAIFLLIFFSHEELFNSFFIKRKKQFKELKEGDIPDEDIYYKNKKIISRENAKFGFTKEQIRKLPNVKEEVTIRLCIPIAFFIFLNFYIFLLGSLSINYMVAEISLFLVVFLFVSFFVGGTLALLMMVFYAIKHFSETSKIFTYVEKIGFIILTIIVGLTIFFSLFTLTYLFALAYLYYFIKGAKSLEKVMFVKKRSLNLLVPGDWIEQDIVINSKTYYTKGDFRLGIDEEQLQDLKRLAKNHKELRELYIKDGIAFVPILFVGFLVLLLL